MEIEVKTNSIEEALEEIKSWWIDIDSLTLPGDMITFIIRIKKEV